MKDPNETVHVYEYDEIGRATQDRITAFGAGANLDQAVKRIGTRYNHQGKVDKVTSYDNATVGAGSVVNEVAFVYNGFGQLLDDKQEHSGAVDGSTPKVSYGYANGASGNTVRRTSVTYPNGRRVDLSYGAANSHDDLLSRIGSFKINGETHDLVDYTYVGAARYVKIAYEQPGIELSYLKGASDPVGDAGDPYTGYDRFGRTVDMKWIMTSGGAVRDRFQWGYDRSSNRTWRRNLAATSGGQDEKYGYDGLYQVKADARGTLNINGTAIGGIPAENEAFNYDPTGNWLGYQKAEDGTVTVDQTRVNNQDNQVVQFDGSSALVSYDRAGNATLMPPDKDGNFGLSYLLKWDGWNRLVQIVRKSGDALTPVAEYTYDGLYRRITKKVGIGNPVIHPYYSDRWKCLEEREDSGTDAVAQYVWGQRPNHRDELILRDRDTTANGTLDERLYALMDYFNCTSVVDTSGTVQERYGYSAFGVRRVMAADFSSRATSSFDWEFGFQGQFLDLESGYVNYGFRYYVPLIGRWVKRDLIGEEGGVNLYGFVENHALGAVDVLGLEKRDCSWNIYHSHGAKKDNYWGNTTCGELNALHNSSNGALPRGDKLGHNSCYRKDMNGLIAKLFPGCLLPSANIEHNDVTWHNSKDGDIPTKDTHQPNSYDELKKLWNNSINDAQVSCGDENNCCRTVTIIVICPDPDYQRIFSKDKVKEPACGSKITINCE